MLWLSKSSETLHHNSNSYVEPSVNLQEIIRKKQVRRKERNINYINQFSKLYNLFPFHIALTKEAPLYTHRTIIYTSTPTVFREMFMSVRVSYCFIAVQRQKNVYNAIEPNSKLLAMRSGMFIEFEIFGGHARVTLNRSAIWIGWSFWKTSSEMFYF